MATVRVDNVSLRFGKVTALDDVSLTFADGSFFGLLGPSGSGKTTLLRVIAGFEYPDSGTVTIAGESVERVPVEKREIGMMFQNYALFPNMSVYDNVAFGLRVRRVDAAERRQRVADALDLVQLHEQADRRPQQLSGGQRQRVALARAIVTRPRVLLLDEPLSALDKALRMEMQIELKRIQREVGITTIFVTHDQEEALTLSDEIGILRDGALVQKGPPLALYHRPDSRFAAQFLGDINLFDGQAHADGLQLPDGSTLAWPGQRGSGSAGSCIAIRPESITLSAAEPPRNDSLAVLPGTIDQFIYSGPTVTCLLQAGGQTVKVLVRYPEMAGLPESGTVWLCWPRSAGQVLPA